MIILKLEKLAAKPSIVLSPKASKMIKGGVSGITPDQKTLIGG